LRDVYPDYPWKEGEMHWRLAPRSNGFKPSGYWGDMQNQRALFDKIAISLNIRKPEDWYTVRTDTVRQAGASFLATKYKGSLING
jgi:hypothetical protein